MLDHTTRVIFLTHIYRQLVSQGYTFQSNPDFRQYKHGNLKFTDEALTYRTGTNKVIITLEHYHIKREGWHPIYWGLQSFDHTGTTAVDPATILEKETIVKNMEAKLSARLNHKIDLSLIEPKFGWFAWICFQFPGTTNDLDDPNVNIFIAQNMDEMVHKCITELMVYINAWREVIAELT